MAKAASVFHSVNGYSRYDVPESKAFSCTPGPLYPVRIQFINARDRVKIAQGIDVRSNPLAVPTFNPYIVRLHRFWVPLQLYHPEMRTNSSKFDMNNLTTNWYPCTCGQSNPSLFIGSLNPYPNSLMHWLRSATSIRLPKNATLASDVNLEAGVSLYEWSNADTYLAYWDIVRNYYGYSQWGLYSFVFPANWSLSPTSTISSDNPYGEYGAGSNSFNNSVSIWNQCYGNLEFLDAYFESQFYPNSVSSPNLTFNRSNLFTQILASNLDSAGAAASTGYPVSTKFADDTTPYAQGPGSQLAATVTENAPTFLEYFLVAHPLAVVPSNPDRFSRLIPSGESDDVSMTGVTTIPQLAIASRLQEYKDLLGAGGSRYSDWLETFFASKIEHVDRPKLLFSASQTVNVQVVMNQAGSNMFEEGSQPLGQQGGAIAFNSQLGRAQSYYFSEPGYLIDMFSIRPVYYWSAVKPDYLNYLGSDYFNPIYNDIGYQDVPAWRFYVSSSSNKIDLALAREPIFNEFRSSYDEVLGSLSVLGAASSAPNLYSYWVQQRTGITESVSGATSDPTFATYYPFLFVDMSTVNSPFASKTEDNFFVNMSYSVRVKNLVNKSFATRLSNR